ncbi:AaceriADL186Cp [[Ashbya] aceris (nom. inval.)]|nr:AaceriADL186Cp [[Ashbya] aceris (nom. inval.)]
MGARRESGLHSFLNRKTPPTADMQQGSGGTRPQPFSRFTYGSKSAQSSGGMGGQAACSPKGRGSQRSLLSSNFPFMESVFEDRTAAPQRTPTPRDERSEYFGEAEGSSGLRSSLQCSRELASLDKINDAQARMVVVAGKSHLGLYKFDEAYRMQQVHDYMTPGSLGGGTKFSSSIRRNMRKISTISDVKAGFHHRKNYIAICGTSTSVSIYDINRASAKDSPLITTLSEHSRSINSVDFNMGQTHLLISGGQDGCIKVWDLRSHSFKVNRSDLNFNSGSDSVRDVKWMPTYDFGSMGADPSLCSSGRSHKFASVHDSGLLLTFDIRQPNQVERKINAHSGPGLCMHWHPHMDYIISGGRDGKCALWYVGDKVNGTVSGPQGHNSATSYSINTAPITTGYLETMINTSHPVSKLKFRPKYVHNMLNSLIATSSMGEDSDVTIYSLARKHIPQNILTTAAPSLGFVWWNEDIVFNIDKQNVISAWDIRYEPTLLDNLPKGVVTWRDMDGSGLVFVAQDKGTYSIDTGGAADSVGKGAANRMSNTTLNSTNNLGRDAEAFTFSTFQQQYKHQDHEVNDRESDQGHDKDLEKGREIEADQHYHYLRDQEREHHQEYQEWEHEPLARHDDHQETQQPEFYSHGYNDRPMLSKTLSSYSSKIASPILSYYGAQTLSHHTSVVSNSPSISGAALEYPGGIEPPIMITLDLPQVFDSVRASRLADRKTSKSKANSGAGKESAVDIFKYLVRELELCHVQERNDPKSISVDERSKSLDDTELKIQLMENIGLSEHNTWATLIRSTTSMDTDDPAGGLTQGHNKFVDMGKLQGSNVLSPDSSDIEDDFGDKLDDMGTARLQENVNHLVGLIFLSTHNAETYASINDLQNFKIWMLIRDSLLNDLKEATDSSTARRDASSGAVTSEKNGIYANTSTANHPRQDSLTSNFSSFEPSDISRSDGEEKLNLGSLSEKNGESTDRSTTDKLDEIRNLVSPSINCSDPSLLSETGNATNDQSTGLADLKARLRGRYTASNESVLEIEEESSATVASSKHKNTECSSSIPIRKTEARTSFIDTIMTNLRSPGLSHLDVDNDAIFGKGKTSTSLGSGASKRSSMHSTDSYHKRPYSSPITYSKITTAAQKAKLGLTDHEGLPPRRNISFLANIDAAHADKLLLGKLGLAGSPQDGKLLPPWDTGRLIQQLYQYSVETGNIILTVCIILLFQTMYKVTSTRIVKSTLAEFITILHRYEMFEISAHLLKNCPWDDILGAGSGQSTVRLFCENCGKLIVNEHSKAILSKRHQAGDNNVINFGYWYCDSCRKPNSLCVYCEQPMKKLALSFLNCGHGGHFECLQQWFLDEGMSECPSGCSGVLL